MDKMKSAAVWVAVLLVIGIGGSVISNAWLLPDSAWLEINKMYVTTVTTGDRNLTLNIIRTVSRVIPVKVTISIYRQNGLEVPCFDFHDEGVWQRSWQMREGVLSYSQGIPIEGKLEVGNYVAELYIEFAVGSFGIRRNVTASTSFVVVEAKGV